MNPLRVTISTSLCVFFVFFFALLFPEMTCQSNSVASAVAVGIFFSFFWFSYVIWSFTPAISVDANHPILHLLLLLLFLPIKLD